MTAQLSKPQVLIVNDDQSLCETRRMLLEDCGAMVTTACGIVTDIEAKLTPLLDLILIDATNVGRRRGEELCGVVKRAHPVACVALLVQPEVNTVENTQADHVISRTGPRRILVEIDELLGGRLDLNLWEEHARYAEENHPPRSPE